VAESDILLKDDISSKKAKALRKKVAIEAIHTSPTSIICI
jgi:hypothetical protein